MPAKDERKTCGCVRASVASDAYANDLENQRLVLSDCEQVFEDAGSEASWNRSLDRDSVNVWAAGLGSM